MEEVKKEESKEEIEVIKKDNKEYKLSRSNSWMKATIIVLLFIIALLVMTMICLFSSQTKCKDDTSENKTKEEIKDFGSRLDEFTINKDETKEIKVNGFFVNIKNKQDGVYLNNRKIDFMYASGGYVLDKFLILYSSEKTAGKKLIFLDYDLNIIKVEDNELLYNNLTLENGMLLATVTKFDSKDTCKEFNNLEVCECTVGAEPLVNYKDFLIDFNDEVATGEVKLVYKDQKISIEYENKVTVSEYYKSDVNGETNKYCAKKY